MDFTAHAQALVRALNGTEDNNPRAQRQRIEFIAQIDAFVKAWRTLFKVFTDPPAQRQAFERL